MDGSEDQHIRRGTPGPPRRPPSRAAIRDVVSVALAVVIIIHETLAAGTAEPALLALAAGLLGIPLAARGGR